MDKDFIKIDDLLRQRLGGGEETERSGSWLNMRELLDKEMPQEKPAGIMYWRRTFGVVAALSLVAAIGIGWYQYSTAYNNQGTGNDRAIADMVNGRVSNGPVSGNDAGAVYQTSEQAGNNSAQPAVAGKAMHNATVANNMQSANASTSANQSNTTTNTPNSNVAATNIANNNGVAGNNSDNSIHSSTLATNNTTHNSSEHTSVPHTATASANKATSVVAINTAADKNKQQKVTNRAQLAIIDKALAARSNDVKTETNIPAANKPAPATSAPGIADAKGVNVDKLPVGSAATVGNNRTADNTLPTGALKIPAANADVNTPAVNNNRQRTSNEGITANSLKPSPAVHMTIDNATMRTIAAANLSKGKKVIDRMVLHEKYIQTAPNEGYFKLDTISVETMITDLGLNMDDPKSYQYNKKAPAKAHTPAAGKVLHGGSKAQPEEHSSNLLPASQLIINSSTNLKAANAGQKSAGSKMVEKLNETFNDIKYKFGAPRFQPGITAGVNGTFFGPNSFKGFQFGFAGNLVFNDQWSIMSELKYFQRVNGNTSISDNYSTYTPTANGQFTRQEHINAYSFSALHSLELPVSVRYCMGNFNFFAGGNLAYNFAINTGAESLPIAPNATTVAAVGNDNAPKLKEQDFNSRVGLGYLIGLSYNVGANTMLDVRSVQTVWESTNSDGARTISGQLYRSPSMQLSLIYRFGGNKNK